MYVNVVNKSKGNSNQINSGLAQVLDIEEKCAASPYLLPTTDQATNGFFRLFPIISISQKFFSFFFLTLEKIGIDEKVICYHNISN